MSKNNKKNNDIIEVSIIRSSDGCKRHLSMPLNSTLTNLKQKINSDPNLGPLSPSQQRLFHLGRELKSANRSLEALGIGRFRVFTVHLHAVVKSGKASAKAVAVYSGSEEEDDNDVQVVDMTSVTSSAVSNNNRNRTTTSSTNNGSNRRRRNQKNDNNEVVDLLDSDSDDDDDDVVEIVEPTSSTGNKRRKRN